MIDRDFDLILLLYHNLKSKSMWTYVENLLFYQILNNIYPLNPPSGKFLKTKTVMA